jgi:hypothetical protein
MRIKILIGCKYKFYAIACTQVKYLRDIKLCFDTFETTFQTLIADYKLTQIFEVDVLMSKGNNF